MIVMFVTSTEMNGYLKQNTIGRVLENMGASRD